MDADADVLWVDDHDVALGDVGGRDHNTIVLSGVDVVVPLEMDMASDPLQDDVIYLRSTDGHHEQSLTSRDEGVEVDREAGLHYFRFRLVPPGSYAVFARAQGHVFPLIRGLVVSRSGVFVSGKKLEAKFPSKKAAPAEVEEQVSWGSAPETSCGH